MLGRGWKGDDFGFGGCHFASQRSAKLWAVEVLAEVASRYSRAREALIQGVSINGAIAHQHDLGVFDVRASLLYRRQRRTTKDERRHDHHHLGIELACRPRGAHPRRAHRHSRFAVRVGRARHGGWRSPDRGQGPPRKHGEWMPWLEEHCKISDRTARLYMRVAKNRAEIVLDQNGKRCRFDARARRRRS